jgi:hypothetical protein
MLCPKPKACADLLSGSGWERRFEGLTGSSEVARSIVDKIVACTAFVGDVTPVGKSPDKAGNEAIKLSRPLISRVCP